MFLANSDAFTNILVQEIDYYPEILAIDIENIQLQELSNDFVESGLIENDIGTEIVKNGPEISEEMVENANNPEISGEIVENVYGK